ncbi:MAG TPA: 2-oxo acid dehydrogenase subunit E2 [Bacteroidales bacterium]|nr:2-oxo acid dehydrogenase subunit E2 [Bacteroidales bacterium]
MTNFKLNKFPKTRIATNDVCSIGLKKHHIAALLEMDVTESREKIKQYKRNKNNVSFTAWLLKTISITIKDYADVAAYLKGKRELILFDDINISLIVEKELDGQKIPVPILIEKAQERSMESITEQINNARSQNLSEGDIVLHKKSNRIENLYYHFPGFIRRYIWKFLLNHPKIAFSKMGNVSVTSLGMIGKANGWFIPIAVHPVCFGISRIIKKPVVKNDKIEVREILNMTVLLDHDVIDGAVMARFISKLTENIENGVVLQ